MSENKEYKADGLDLADLFADDVGAGGGGDDLFADDVDVGLFGGDGNAVKAGGGKGWFGVLVIVFVVFVNTAVICGGCVWIYYNLDDVLSKIAWTGVGGDGGSDGGSAGGRAVEQAVEVEEKIEFEGGVSFSMAEGYFNDGDYGRAFAAYEILEGNLTLNIDSDRYLSDYLHLKMGLSLVRDDVNADASRYFEVAGDSRSPFVKALTHYHLAFIQIGAGRYLDARVSGYQALGLSECFKEYSDANFERDCYFIVCEALTREVLAVCNRSTELPAGGWTGDIGFQTIIPDDQEQLRAVLEAGIEDISGGSLIPKVSSREHEKVGLKYSAVAVGARVDEVLERTASAAGHNVLWEKGSSSGGFNEVTINCLNSSSQMIAEVAAGCGGLVARFDEPDILVYDPDGYESLDDYKELLASEAIAVWRRFLMRYRGDHRAANASYARALMLECDGHVDSAINHYSRTANNFVHNELAAYCLLNSAKLRTGLMDYAGAKTDLTQLVMEYDDSAIANDAYLELAVTAMSSGHYDDAIESFKRLFNTDMSAGIRARSARGAGMCYLELGDFENADKWLSECVGFEGQVEMDYAPVYFSLGKAKVETGDFDQAAVALKNSLDGDLPSEEIVNILVHLAKVQTRQGKFVKAMDTIESIDTENLSQEMVVETILTKSYILRESELPENAVPVLRQRLAYLADGHLRAKMCFELARCYIATGDYQGGRDELVNALKDLEPGGLANDISFELGRVYFVLGNYADSIELCNMLLKEKLKAERRKELFRMLGDCYSRLEKFDMAAMAYAGRLDERGVPKL